MILTQKLFILGLLVEAHRLSTICMFTVDNVTLNDMSVIFPNWM